MKIAIVRGASLNNWEMQNYLPLTKSHKLLAIGSMLGHYQFNLDIKTCKLICLGEIASFLPGGIKYLYNHYGDPQILLGLGEAIAGFDIVHTTEINSYYSYQALKARQKGLVKRLIITCWENLITDTASPRAQQVLRGADHFLAVTNKAKDILISQGVPTSKISVIPMGVDLKVFKPPLTTDKNKLTILFVGRLVEEKGIVILLEAFKSLNRQVKNKQLLLKIIGDGPLKKKIIQMASKWGIDDKIAIEEKLYSEMAKEYEDAYIFVLPSIPTRQWQEQFGMAIVEAMACGLPIVSTKTGSISEVVGNAGILVSPGNNIELAKTIKRLIDDSKLRQELAVRGRQRAEKLFDCQKVADKINRLYYSVL